MMTLGSADVQIYKSCVDVPSGLSPTWDKRCSFSFWTSMEFFYTQVELFTCQLETDFVLKIDTFGWDIIPEDIDRTLFTRPKACVKTLARIWLTEGAISGQLIPPHYPSCPSSFNCRWEVPRRYLSRVNNFSGMSSFDKNINLNKTIPITHYDLQFVYSHYTKEHDTTNAHWSVDTWPGLILVCFVHYKKSFFILLTQALFKTSVSNVPLKTQGKERKTWETA